MVGSNTDPHALTYHKHQCFSCTGNGFQIIGMSVKMKSLRLNILFVNWCSDQNINLTVFKILDSFFK